MSKSALTIAVAMGVYNGASFIREQLTSIAGQTHLPSELVVCDDVSTDDTVALIEDFARSSPFPVRLFRNTKNLGLARNFGQAIALCNADLIALSDQDDVWKPEKLEVVASGFEADPDLTLVFTDGDLVDETLNPVGKRLSTTGRIGPVERGILAGPNAFEFLLRRNVATGATMVFRSSLRDLVLPVPMELSTYHDAWIVHLAAATSKIAYLHEPLMLYRQHEGQQTWDFVYVHGAQKVLDQDHYAKHLGQLRALRDRLVAFGGEGSAARLTHVEDYIEHLEFRASLPRGLNRAPRILKELTTGRYGRYSSGWRSAGRDLIS